MVVNILCTYASSSGLYRECKIKFWEHLDQELSATLDGESVTVGGHLN